MRQKEGCWTWEAITRGADLEVWLFKLLQNSHPISGQLTTSTYLEVL